MKNAGRNGNGNGNGSLLLDTQPRWDKSGITSLTMEELTRSNKELEQFAFIAAHDLQEPLRVSSSYAQLLDRKYSGRLDGKADRIIAAILKNNERMARLIHSLLEFSQAGRGKAQFKELDSSILLGQVIENLKLKIHENAAQIICVDCPVIKGDEMQLTQLFQNLLMNAIKFRKKEEKPEIHISAKEKRYQWFFSVRDNGIGVDPEHAQVIFDPFRRLHTQGEYAGSGIGLALCKRIVEFHRGKIWIESEVGKGTTVCFTIHKAVGRGGKS